MRAKVAKWLLSAFSSLSWEVLNGVGVDGVGVTFPFFYAFSPFFYAFFPLATHLSASPKGQGQTAAIYYKNGEFHSDPVCTDPVQNFPTELWSCFGGSQKGGFQKGGFGGFSPVPETETRVHSDVPLYQRTEDRNQGTFGCSLVARTGTGAHLGSRLRTPALKTENLS